MTPTTPGGRRRRSAPAAFGLLTLLGAVLLGWALTHQVADPPAPDPTAARPAATATPPPHQEPAQQQEPAQPASASPEVEPLPASEPVRVRIPAIGVTSPLHALGLDPDGTLQVPSGDRYDQAAWYDGSPTPGEVGGAVIEGHVTSQGSTPSVFYDLGALTPGDRVHVDRADGTTATFEVDGVESFPKDDFPKVAVYGNTEVPELRLITCGGSYDPDQRRHLDNVVVFARMVDTH